MTITQVEQQYLNHYAKMMKKVAKKGLTTARSKVLAYYLQTAALLNKLADVKHDDHPREGFVMRDLYAVEALKFTEVKK